MIISANILINIMPNTEYVPVDGGSVIYQLHCVKTNSCPVKIVSFGSHEYTEFPPGSFIQGAVYPIVVYKMEFDPDSAEFIGYASTKNIDINGVMTKGWMSRYINKQKKN